MCSATQERRRLLEGAQALGVVLAARTERLRELEVAPGLVRAPELLIPSDSRIEALSGSRFFAFSSETVACAAMPFLR